MLGKSFLSYDMLEMVYLLSNKLVRCPLHASAREAEDLGVSLALLIPGWLSSCTTTCHDQIDNTMTMALVL